MTAAAFLPPSPKCMHSLDGLALLVALVTAPVLLLGDPVETAPADPGDPRETRPATRTVRYGRDIRPILADRCFACHGPDPGARKENLRLDARESAILDRGGYAVIVPGDPDASEIWRRIQPSAGIDRMPPDGSHKRELNQREQELVRRWIEDGAEYESHWAFTPPVRPSVPDARDSTWPLNPIDRFLLARMELEDIDPSSPAASATLLRRVFLDLTGLPPTPEEYDAFAADTRTNSPPGAYERWVDRLLTEEPYVTRHAERMATPWLDAARYGDTNGIHTDAGRQMWAWRDWVLHAFRAGMPYDQFLTEQMAGDLILDATQAQMVASGFNRNHVITDEGGAIDEEYLVEYAVDRTATTGTVFLGLTVGCARCHEHKFDPISHEEFYGLYAYFNSNDEKGLYSQESGNPTRAFAPSMSVPSPEQEARLKELIADLQATQLALDTPAPGEEKELEQFLAHAPTAAGMRWAGAETVGARSTGGAVLTIQDDGSVLASGENPGHDKHVITLRTDGTDLRVLMLEALQDPSHPSGSVGRAGNGNAVLSAIEVEAISVADPAVHKAVPLVWAWADHEQQNGDFDVVNAIAGPEGNPKRGWAVNAHGVKGGRTALFLSEEPFGFPGGTELRVTLIYESFWLLHSLGRVRLTPGSISAEGLASLPVADSRWYGTWPYSPESRYSGYDQVFGPEADGEIDFAKKYEPDDYSWVQVEALADGKTNTNLPAGEKVSFAGKRLYVPSARTLDVSLGSDDGIQVFLDGAQIFERRIDRGVKPDQEQLQVDLTAGIHTLVLKVVNTGGVGGFYWQAGAARDELQSALVWALVPAGVRTRGADGLVDGVRVAWRTGHSPEYRENLERQGGLERDRSTLEEAIPETMVMREREEMRETFVLLRGQYDQPDKSRPVARGVPAALGNLPEGAPADRRGLAAWMTAPGNPMVARVAVNRLWEMVFGTGIVATVGDLGLQGEWPSHPGLLDWLAVEYIESGWDTKALLRLMVTSRAYRQSARIRPEVAEVDPGGRLIAAYPRRRLGAEEVRDQALYLAGLLVEKMGGPSVKPYQPEGLWKEVAMVQSNTRNFERGEGDDLWRRSLYTYWKRAVPPPSLQTFDAPGREFCTVRRRITNTPLQALVLWNDEQYVEAARVLAQRTLAVPDGGTQAEDDDALLASMFRRCTGRQPEPDEAVRIRAALDACLVRFAAAPEDAALLLETGDAPLPSGAMNMDAPRLAAWTLVANAMLSLDEVISRN